MNSPKVKLENIPDENRVLTCPHCKAIQSELNYKQLMHTNTNWTMHKCDICKKDFVYVQFVERIYVATKLVEDSNESGD